MITITSASLDRVANTVTVTARVPVIGEMSIVLKRTNAKTER